MYSVEHQFTNLLKDRLIIPRKIVGVLYVDRQGASFPIGCLPRIARLSSGTKGGRRQADSGTTCPEQIPSQQDECYRERIYNIKESEARGRVFAPNRNSLITQNKHFSSFSNKKRTLL